jgi:DNA-binding transcriptional MerR regulator/disulfide oxidoreductase YuzD/methylmalonyl-CoA mutase cobalamin-binding subunit
LDKKTPSFNLNVVVRETGIKPDTLRAWERRYGLPEPVRTEGGHRLYSTNDIELIKWLMARQKEGMRISQAVQLWKDYQAEGTDPLNPQPPTTIQPLLEDLPVDSALAQLREGWINACLDFNEVAADQVLAQAFARYPVQLACIEVLQKGLSTIGNQWYQGGASVQQEHFASALAAKRLNALISAAPAPTLPERILVGCPPGEEHTFSTLVANLSLRYHGFDVTYLGANVPIAHLKETIEKVRADMVVYTAMQLDAAASLLDAAELMDGMGVRFAFGGRIFSTQPELQRVIPGFFLGERLDRVADEVIKVLAGEAQANPAFEIPADFQSALEAFERIKLSLELDIYRHYANSDFPVDYLEIINHHFNKFVRAALALGDLDYLEPEISWSETLIANNRIPAELINDYLKGYYQFLKERIGEQGHVLTSWLAQRLGM